ncbi:HD-GYP domain-containing protein [Paenibacillus agricola]|uniref:HD-GYP domain-containing protein n=1 Tax=Paenibacillus agricola TaxID=2716264 RepID=UPI0035D41CFD
MKKDEIPVVARICAICDVYDALVSSRSYKNEWSHKDAIQYIFDHSGTHFDEYIVRCFMKLVN